MAAAGVRRDASVFDNDEDHPAQRPFAVEGDHGWGHGPCAAAESVDMGAMAKRFFKVMPPMESGENRRG